MTTYSPAETSTWTLAQWNNLAGKRITLTLEGQVWEWERVVDRVRFSDSPYAPDQMVTVEWDECGSLLFAREPGAGITVHD